MTIINHEYYVSLEIAKLLKKVGFDWQICDGYVMYGDDHGFTTRFQTPHNFNGDNGDLFLNYGGHKEVLSMPTLDVAQRYLREVKCISVEIGIDINGKWKVLCCKYPINNKWPDDWCLLDDTDDTNPSYSTYEEAQEAGIKKVLELILMKGE